MTELVTELCGLTVPSPSGRATTSTPCTTGPALPRRRERVRRARCSRGMSVLSGRRGRSTVVLAAAVLLAGCTGGRPPAPAAAPAPAPAPAPTAAAGCPVHQGAPPAWNAHPAGFSDQPA